MSHFDAYVQTYGQSSELDDIYAGTVITGDLVLAFPVLFVLWMGATGRLGKSIYRKIGFRQRTSA